MASPQPSKPRRKIDISQGQSALQSWIKTWNETGVSASTSVTKLAVRFTLEELASQYPGNSVEVRVPPYGVIQCIEGPRHTRGTPPNIVEVSPHQWLQLVTGLLSWEEANLSASGTRSNLENLLPLFRNISQKS